MRRVVSKFGAGGLGAELRPPTFNAGLGPAVAQNPTRPDKLWLLGCLFPYFHLPLAGTLRRTCALLYDSSAPAARILGPRGEGERDDFPAHSRSCQSRLFSWLLFCGVLSDDSGVQALRRPRRL